MSVPFINSAFVAGEVSPSLFGRIDLAQYRLGASTMRNMTVSYKGGSNSRAGTSFVGFSKQTGRTVPPRLITFQFSINQGLALEFGNLYMRVVSNGAFVTETPITLSNVTANAGNNTFVTSSPHGFSVGDWVFPTGVTGTLGPVVNNKVWVIVSTGTSTSFEVTDVYGVELTYPVPATGLGGTVARIYTLATPYAEADLSYLKFTQSADVMSICCWNQVTGTTYQPQDLSRTSNNNWSISAPTFAATIAAPTGVAGTTSSAGTTDYQYVVTAVSLADGSESVASAIINVPNSVDIATTAGSLKISWDNVDGAGTYNTYKARPATQSNLVPSGSLFGYMGTTYGTTFLDTNITPDFTQVPPIHENPFAPGAITSVLVFGGGSYAPGTIPVITVTSGTGSGVVLEAVMTQDGSQVQSIIVITGGQDYLDTDTVVFTPSTGGPDAFISVGPSTGTYPSVVAYFQERRVYAATPNNPDTYFMSQPGSFTNFDSRIPTIPSDAITGTPWSVEVNGIQFMVSMPGGLVALTGLSAWQLTGAGGSSLNPQPITPANQQAQPQAYNGCSSTVPPIKIDYDIMYVQAKGSIVRDLSYNFFANIYTGADLTEVSSQLFTGFTIREWAWCEEPFKILWAVRNDGVLLSLTYNKPQEVEGWARHDTNGFFQSVCSVTEPPVDALYCAVQRFPGTHTAYMIERMDNRLWAQAEDVWAVDCGLTIPLPEPNATLTFGSATGLGELRGITNLIGGKNYSGATTGTIVDNNGQGPGTGATPTLVIVGGVITNVGFIAGHRGSGYINPQLVIVDPAGDQGGSGASAKCTLLNTVSLTADSPVFGSAAPGWVVRAGGGICVLTAIADSTHVTGNFLQPITETIPNSGGLVAPFPSGTWNLAPPVTTISGLDYLEGAMVTGLADGNVVSPRVVTNGSVTLDTSATLVTLGLGFRAQVQTLRIEVGQPTTQGQRKKIGDVTARLEQSRGVQVGQNQPDGSAQSPLRVDVQWLNMQPVPDIDVQDTNVIPAYNRLCDPLYTADRRLPIPGGFQTGGQVALQQDYPLPLQVLAVIPEILAGDTPQTQATPRQEKGRSMGGRS